MRSVEVCSLFYDCTYFIKHYFLFCIKRKRAILNIYKWVKQCWSNQIGSWVYICRCDVEQEESTWCEGSDHLSVRPSVCMCVWVCVSVCLFTRAERGSCWSWAEVQFLWQDQAGTLPSTGQYQQLHNSEGATTVFCDWGSVSCLCYIYLWSNFAKNNIQWSSSSKVGLMLVCPIHTVLVLVIACCKQSIASWTS